jgi:cystathionine beta-synthase
MMSYKTILETIGNTPLVKIDFDIPATVYAKLEYINPSGSIKDRAAYYMICKAEKSGELKPGGTIIEASSGNQGIATAMIGAIKGYSVIITVSEKVSVEKRKTLEAYGAHVITCPATNQLDDPQSYHTHATALARTTPNSYMLNQYYNPDNKEAHYGSLGPELWNQIGTDLTHFVAGAGSGGTISGSGAFLKEKNNNINILAVDSPCSYRSTNGNPQPYQIEGMGVDFHSPNLDNDVIDDFLFASDSDAIAMLKILARDHGLLVGPASGAVAHATYTYAQNLSEHDTVVMLFGDSGRAYLTKGYYDSY